jgi:hypothetical protein
MFTPQELLALDLEDKAANSKKAAAAPGGRKDVWPRLVLS